jgi:hypothetical protein
LIFLIGSQPVLADDYWSVFSVERVTHQASLVIWYDLGNAQKCLFQKHRSARQELNTCAKGINETIDILNNREILTPSPIYGSKSKDRMGLYGLIVEQFQRPASVYRDLADGEKADTERERAIRAARASKNNGLISWAERY